MREQIDRYKIEKKLDQGGMADVYLAHDPRFDRHVAIKVLGGAALNSSANRDRFDREARTIANLEHRAIVPVYDFGYDTENMPFLVMRYMQGGSLRRRLEERGALPLDQVIQIANRLAVALDEAHSKKIIHRDIKPANILLNREDVPFLSDFGIARLVEQTSSDFTLIGTAQYMAPEQWTGKHLNFHTDVYQFGVTLFELLSGEKPYQGYDREDFKQQHLNAAIPSICAINNRLPASCDDVFARALAKNPSDRYKKASDLASALAQTMPASQINKRYEIQEVIKRGGMGAVYRALDTKIHREVALKILHNSLANDPIFQKRFEEEMQIVGHLEDDAIVRIYDVGDDENGRPFLVLRLMSGQSLRELLDREQRLPPERVLNILERLVSALETAHEQEIIHRDLKPDNVLFDSRGRAYLSDFGISLSLNKTRLTQAGEIVGTFGYMAPEQITNPTHLSIYTDIYQLGVLTFEMLTGQLPFNMMYQHINEPPPSAVEIVDTLPYAVDVVLHKAMAKEPEARYQSPSAFYRALSLAFPEKITKSDVVVPLPIVEDVSFWHRWRWWLVAGGLVLAVLLGIYLNRPAPMTLAACLQEARVEFVMDDSLGGMVRVVPGDTIPITADQAAIELFLQETAVCPVLEPLITASTWENPAIQDWSPTVVRFNAEQFDATNDVVNVSLTFSRADEVVEKDYFVRLAVSGGG